MIFPSKEPCNKCNHDIPEFIYVCECDCHNWVGLRESITITKKDCQTLYSLLEHQYIHYDNLEAHKLLKRISDFIGK